MAVESGVQRVLIARLRPYLAPERWRLSGAIVATVLSGALGLGFPWVLGGLVDSALTATGGVADLNRAAVLLLGIFAAQALCARVRILLLATAGQHIVNALRSALFNRMIRFPMAALGRRSSGALTSRLMTDAAFAYGSASGSIPRMAYSLVTSLGAALLMVTIDVRLALVVLLVIPVAVVVGARYGRRMRELSRGYQNGLAATNALAGESLASAAVVKWFSAERSLAGRYHRGVQDVTAQGIARGRARATWTPAMMFLASLGIVGVVWIGGRQVHAGTLTAGALVSFLLYARFVADGLSNSVTDYSKLAQGMGAIERVIGLLAEPVEPVGQRRENKADADTAGKADAATADRVVIAQREGAVSFADVTFRYPGRAREVLRQVSFAIEPGTTVALVGPSGAGKSTVAALIARMYDGQAGSVRVDGVDVRQQDLTDLRRCMAVVPQDVMLLSGTIADNIRLGRRNASRDDVARAARIANAADFIESFPSGYGTRVGERGLDLSGGQRQRIAIARAVLADPRLLILDEATNALDTDTEALVQDALGRLMRGRTNLVIAHRLTTVLQADRVIVLDAGQVVETGTPAELLQRDSRFAAMTAAQALGLGTPGR